MKFIKIYFSIIFLLLSVVLFPQEIKPGKPNELDNIYSPDKASSKPILNSSSVHLADKKNFLKYNLGFIPRSTFALHYERKFNDVISLVGGLGYNYNKDKIQTSSAEGDFYLIDNSVSSLSINEIITNNVYKNGANLFASASLKISYVGLYSFLYDDERRNFIQFECRYAAVNSSLYGIKNSTEQVQNGNNLLIKNTCYLVHWGYQFTAGNQPQTSHEFLVGFGVRKINYNVFTPTVGYDPYGQPITIHQKTISTETVTAPMVTLAYIIGFGF